MCRLILALLSVTFIMCDSTGWITAQQPDKKAIDKDLQPLQGVWAQVSVLSNGQQEGFIPGQEPVLTIQGDKYMVGVNGKVAESGTLKLGPPAKPRAIDFVAVESGDFKRTYPGIYEVSGDKLRTCLARGAVDRPTEFSARAGSSLVVAVYRRLETK
jgi:uncharacterized protein (TIGR03067 family)